jgi:hypothetical protein
MLFNPKWKKTTKRSTPRRRTMAHLIAWLEQQPRDKYYVYCDPRTCLAAQYNAALGRRYGHRHSPAWDRFDNKVEEIAVEADPRTFGGALKLARAKAA